MAEGDGTTANEILIVKKRRDELSMKVKNRAYNKWSPNKYEKIINNRDFNHLAYLFSDLEHLGYPVEKAIERFRALKNKPSLFFLDR